jgi:hypothetical protein
MSRRARQSASKSSAPVVVPAGRRTTTRVVAGATLDRRQGGATLVEASITARLLGMRLLTLDAKVALVPADVTVAGPRSREPAVRVPALSSGNSRGRADRAGGHRGLADAVRNLNEGERLLAEVQRRDGAPG